MSRYYTKEHEWLEEEAGVWRLGITTFAAESLGDIVYVDLPEPDTDFDADAVVCGIESVKTAADVFLPLAGTVTAVNEALADAPELLNEDASSNWLLEFSLEAAFDSTGLMSETEYKDWLAEENA